jgi:A/G-specific adenine glycosylase
MLKTNLSPPRIIHEWYQSHKRDLPWRKTTSPYHIWISEVILQQTRVEQGISYYNHFIQKFPELHDLAMAEQDQVLKAWQGLGYYTRARNLHSTAQTIIKDYQGRFPDTYEELIRLRGIGPYTAAAVASIAFGRPVAVVDGNVSRVIARLFGIILPVNTPAGNAAIRQVADEMLESSDPGMHNQAMMEFGALVCLPANPQCGNCPLTTHCKAFAKGLQRDLPVRDGKTDPRPRYFNYLYICRGNIRYLHKRLNNDIWKGLYDFPLIETETKMSFKEIAVTPNWKQYLPDEGHFVEKGTVNYTHKLTHQTIYCTFYRLEADPDQKMFLPEYLEVLEDRINDYAVPRVIERYLSDLKRSGLR